MTFLNIGIGAWALGLLGIAAVLYLLQRLRVKYREVEVVTTMFWKQAVEETRARVLVRKFRHPLSFLLALAIAGLVWLAFAEPRWDHDDEGDYLLLLDGSAAMDHGGRFEAAKALILREAKRLPAERRRVYFCGADARLILDRGEEAFLLEYRLKDLKLEAAPSSVERELLSMASIEPADTSLKVLVVGDAPVSDATLNALPKHIRVQRLRDEDAPALDGNAGIAAIGVAEAASGIFDRVDVMIDISGDREDLSMTARLGEENLTQAPEKQEGKYYLRDVPASGQILTVELAGKDALALDNTARISLPKRRALTVRLDENVDKYIRMVVDADPGLIASADGTPAQVTIGTAGSAESSAPALEVVTGNGIAVVHEAGLSPLELLNLKSRFEAAGLDRVGRKLDSLPKDAGGSPLPAISLSYAEGAVRKIRIGSDLLGADYDFAQSSALPIFVSNAARWLAGAEPIEPFASAGEHLIKSETLAIAGAGYAPPRAGDYESTRGDKIAVSLASPASSLAATDSLEAINSSTAGGRWPGLVSWLMLAAVVLIGAEWWLFQKGRIP